MTRLTVRYAWTTTLWSTLLALLVACDDDGATQTTGGGGNTASNGAGAGSSSNGTGGNTFGGSFENCPVFLSDNPWNTDISEFPLHPSSDAFIDSIGRSDTMHPDFGTTYENAPIGLPYAAVDGQQPAVPIDFVAFGDESDPGPYPIPPDVLVEGGSGGDGDRHVLVVETDTCMLYELYRGFPVNGGASWEADSGAVWDLTINDTHPDTWTSADAAGLPILPGLVRYDEVVERGAIHHALRFTVSQSQSGYIPPATHYASSNGDPSLPPMGLRLRMKASYDCTGYSSEVQVICTALKTYGMLVADNGSDWFLSGAYDPRWSDDNLADLNDVPGDAFEVVMTGDVKTF